MILRSHQSAFVFFCYADFACLCQFRLVAAMGGVVDALSMSLEITDLLARELRLQLLPGREGKADEQFFTWSATGSVRVNSRGLVQANALGKVRRRLFIRFAGFCMSH